MGILILAAVGFGLFTRKSFKAENLNLDSKENAEVILSDTLDGYFDNDISTYEELADQSDLIVTGSITGKQGVYSQALKTKFHIDQIMKGDSGEKTPENIYVYEPSTFSFDTYDVLSGYNVMKENTDYILFLKHLKIPDGYKYKNDEAITFLPVSTCYSKYTLNDRRTEESVSGSEKLTYEQVKDMGIITDDQEITDTYNALKKEVMDSLGEW